MTACRVDFTHGVIWFQDETLKTKYWADKSLNLQVKLPILKHLLISLVNQTITGHAVVSSTSDSRDSSWHGSVWQTSQVNTIRPINYGSNLHVVVRHKWHKWAFFRLEGKTTPCVNLLCTSGVKTGTNRLRCTTNRAGKQKTVRRSVVLSQINWIH